MKNCSWAIVPVAAFALVGSLFVGCSDDKPKPGTPVTGGNCTAAPGQVPTPDCDPSSNECKPIPGCQIDEAKCGSKSTCLPMGDNTGKDVVDLRIRRLNVIAPPQLAKPFIQEAIIDTGVNLKNVCGEDGDGSLTWLLRVDRKAKTLTTGGAPPVTDPFGSYCFVNADINGLHVEPIRDGAITLNGKSFDGTPVAKLNVPVFVHGSTSNVVILPLSQVFVKGVTLSDDGNCIGTFNPNAVDDLCIDTRASCARWKTAGTIGGYITLEEADKVIIEDLGGKSLCGVLIGLGPDGFHCARDGANKITGKGDFCSTSNKAGDCQDSYWFSATFAASATKINDGSSDPLCKGGSVGGDAGTDAANDATPADAATADSATDAPVDAAQD